MQKRRAHLGPVAALVIGLVATVVVGAIGVAVSIRVSYNQSAVEVDCAFNNNNSSKEITVNADKGSLYYALESCVNKNDTSIGESRKPSMSSAPSTAIWTIRKWSATTMPATQAAGARDISRFSRPTISAAARPTLPSMQRFAD